VMEGALRSALPFTPMADKILTKEEKARIRRKNKIKRVFELVVFSFLLAILITPGLFYKDVVAHEFYHYLRHQDVAEEICIDINKPYWGHVKISFENEEELLKYEAEELNEEERKANMFGHVASVMYLINALIVVNWMLMLVVKRQREKWD